jgi:thiol-disulfide isomerase/thioredoxin
MSRLLRRLAVSAVGLAAVGCGSPVITTKPIGTHPSSEFGDATRKVRADKAHTVTLTETTSAALDQAVAAEKGKVVLLDAWFLACGPCVKKFPHVVELAEKYGPDGLAVMSVDVLESETKSQPEVLAFLTEKRAAFPNYILSDPDAFLAKYGIDSTPAVVLFDRAGKRVDLPRNPTAAQLEAAVRTTLAAGA